MQYNEILFQIDQGIALITLNRPDIRNAVSCAGIIRELEEACKFVNADGSVKTLILTGEDPAFSSGGNIKEMAAKRGMFSGDSAQIMENYRRYIQRIPLAIHGVEVPTIAAVNNSLPLRDFSMSPAAVMIWIVPASMTTRAIAPLPSMWGCALLVVGSPWVAQRV